MANCGIKPQHTYELRIEPSLCNPLGQPIFGQFRPSERVAAVRPLHGCESLMRAAPYDEATSAMSRLPIEDFYRSLVVHEVAHAVAHQAFKVPPTRTAYEYISGVVQLDALPAASRASYVAAFKHVDFTTDMFNELTLAMAPAQYAVAAYRHFGRRGHGCAFLRSLLETERVLPLLP